MRPLLLIVCALVLISLACNAPTGDELSGDEEDQLPDTATATVAAPVSTDPSSRHRSDLSSVNTWLYVLDVNLSDDFVDDIVTSEYDLVVLDFIPSEENNTDYPMAGVTNRLHNAHHPKLVLAYIDIGEAESYRTYWQDEWQVGDPVWIAGEDPDGWDENYPVAYWHDEWRELWLDQDGLLQGIIDAGFDGIYLDWVEAYSDENVLDIAAGDGVNAREEMIWWVSDLAEYSRSRRPDFLVVAQNAAELVDDDSYVEVIDAIAQEQVWFDGGADNVPPGDCPLPRTEEEVNSKPYRDSLTSVCRQQYDEFPESTLHVSSEWYLDYLEQARDKGLVVFTVDYALDPDNVALAYELSREYGFVPFVSNRDLNLYLEPSEE